MLRNKERRRNSRFLTTSEKQTISPVESVQIEQDGKVRRLRSVKSSYAPLFHVVPLEGRKSHLIGEAKRHLSMLQHMIKAQELDLVLGCVDLLIRVFEV